MQIRAETADDYGAIEAVTLAAFAPMPYSSGTEAPIIRALRAAGELSLSLIAEAAGELCGQITFSPVTIDDVHNDWFGLGPVSVAPSHQSTGIGGALIREGLAQMQARGAKGCVLVGDPNYYHRFGFVGDSGLSYKGLDRQYIQQKPLMGGLRTGEILYSPAFEANA